jgi:hypothetical protein
MMVIAGFSKCPEAYVVPNQETIIIIRTFVENWICHFSGRYIHTKEKFSSKECSKEFAKYWRYEKLG